MKKNKEALAALTRKALVDLARQKGLTGYSAMAKDALVAALADKPKAARKPAKTEPPKTAPAKAAPAAKKAPAKKAPAKKAPAKKAPGKAARPGYKPAEAYLAEETATPAAQASLPAKPRFKKTSQAEDLLGVDQNLGELPPSYDEDRVVLLVRDPQWAYAYWDLRRTLQDEAAARGDFRQILRVQELGPDGRPAYFYDVPVPRHARSWYLKLPGDGRRYRVEVGLHHRDGSYAAVATSNPVEMPRATPSEVVADRFITLPLEEPQAPPEPQTQAYLPPVAEWMAAPAPSGEGLPGAPASRRPPAAPAGDAAKAGAVVFEPALPGAGWDQTEVRPWAHPWSAAHPWAPDVAEGAPGPSGPISSHAVSSWGFAPGASEELGRRPAAKDFWLVADAELIVYGATEPDATVTLRGEPVELRPDGTFSFRFYLPDGLHPIPIRARNADEDDERMITITVSRQTAGDGKTNLRQPPR